MNRFFAAIRFLTIVPVPGKVGTDLNDLTRSVPTFPLVGLVIGMALAGLAWIATWLFPPMLAAVLVVLAMTAISGGLHMDGLSDTADGFLSARPRDRMLEIMLDSRIGAMGAMSMVAVLLVKVAALGSLSGDAFWQTAFLMPIGGRMAMVLMLAVLPYARTDGGLGARFYETRHHYSAAWAILVLLIAGWLITANTQMYHGWAGLTAGLVGVGITLFVAWRCYRKIGGGTGDTCGAVCEIVEAVIAMSMAAWPQIQEHLIR